MVSPELITWMKNARSKGYSDDQLKQYLTTKGFSTESINEALLELDEANVESAPRSSPSPSTSTPSQSSSYASSSSSSSDSYKPKKKLDIKAIIYMILIPVCAIGLYFIMFAPTPIACSTNISCNDDLDNTFDMCIYPDTERASCINAVKFHSQNNKATLAVDESISFVSKGVEYVLQVNKIGAASAQISVFSPKKVSVLRSKQLVAIDIDKDGFPDIDITPMEITETTIELNIYIYP